MADETQSASQPDPPNNVPAARNHDADRAPCRSCSLRFLSSDDAALITGQNFFAMPEQFGSEIQRVTR